MIIYRVQDIEGRGPFKPNFSHLWLDEQLSEQRLWLKSWGQEFGYDLLTKEGRTDEWFGSAVTNLEQLTCWFSSTERRRLKHLGYKIARIDDARILAESTMQVVFARLKPLHVDVQIIPWKILHFS